MAGVEADNSTLQARIASGQEHLSSLREPYLKQLAQETKLEYYRLQEASGLADFLIDSRFGSPKVVEVDARWILGTLTLLLLVLVYIDWGRIRRVVWS